MAAPPSDVAAPRLPSAHAAPVPAAVVRCSARRSLARHWRARAAVHREALGAGYYLSLASRIVIYAIAATSLNLVLGYGGLVSFGHAAFVGLGAYATGILVSEGVVGSGWHLLATLAVTGAGGAR